MGLRLGTKYGNSLDLYKEEGDHHIASMKTAGFDDLQGQIATTYYLDTDEAREVATELLSVLSEEFGEDFEEEFEAMLGNAGVEFEALTQ